MKKALLIVVIILVMVGIGYSKDFEDFGNLSPYKINEELGYQGKVLVLMGFYEASSYYYDEIEKMKKIYDLTPDQVEILDRVLEMLYMENISVGPTVDELTSHPKYYSRSTNFWDVIREEFHNK